MQLSNQFDGRLIRKSSPLTGEMISLWKIGDGPKASFLLLLSSVMVADPNQMSNKLLEFGLIVPRQNLTQPQRMVLALMNFDGYVHNGGFGHGCELLDEENISTEEFECWLEMVGAYEHRDIWLQSKLLGESKSNQRYYALRPDLVQLATQYAMQHSPDWVKVEE